MKISAPLFIIVIFLVLTVSVNAQLTEREQQVLDEINQVRTDPTSYFDKIDAYLDYWNSSDDERRTAEELKKELKTMQVLEPLIYSEIIYSSCKKNANKIKKTGNFTHFSSDFPENIQFGNYSPENAVCDLLIDHGIPDRGHRNNILDPNFKYFAVYEHLHITGMKYLFIQQFSSSKPLK